MADFRIECDVAVVGGGFAGSATALLLRRADPRRRVLIIEKRQAFDRKVGESAIELSSWFLKRVLLLDRHLALEHLPKYGLRFWFQNEKVRSLSEASELGNLYLTRVPSYHLDRAVLDEHVFALAREEGAEAIRPALVAEVDLREGGRSTLAVETADGRGEVSARWVIDATGRRAWLARRLGHFTPMPEHPTRSVWARYRNTRDFDSGWIPEQRVGDGTAVSSRGLSTNHLTGPGWWVWVIPLPGGDVSIGVVWDQRLFDLPAGCDLAERFEIFLRAQPAGRELIEGAERVEGDIHALYNLPYRVRRIAGDGWAMVGDAAGFLDPFYSPGLDWAALTVSRTCELIGKSLEGADCASMISRYNWTFTRGFERWFRALYLDKYFYIGDAELMGIALRLETALYYFGVVTPPYRDGLRGLEAPFSLPVSAPFYHLMAFFNRRLANLGRLRLAAGTWGRRNAGRRVFLSGFKLGAGNLLSVPGALARLLVAEIRSLPDRVKAGRSRKLPAGPARAAAPKAAPTRAASPKAAPSVELPRAR